MSLAPPVLSSAGRASNPGVSQPRRRKTKSIRILKPEEYARTVSNFARLKSGAGQNHGSLAEFLINRPPSRDAAITIDPQQFGQGEGDLVTLYPLIAEEPTAAGRPGSSQSASTASQSPQLRAADSDVDPESADERRHAVTNSISFLDPDSFYRHNYSKDPESCIIFMRGFLTALWINNIGARYKVDPEFFCRHLNFRPADDKSNNFSLPSLPSSSWHLIELPAITLGTRDVQTGTLRSDKIEKLRKEGAKELVDHHHCISKLSSSGMRPGEMMIRDFYVFDETHFAVEQRISICMQLADDKTFSLLVWLDSGSEGPERFSAPPWIVKSPESYYLPVIQHKPNIALKHHLFEPNTSEDMGPSDPSARQVSLASLPLNYGRSLRPGIKARDAFYSLTEIFQFAASSQQEFLNLIDIKLDSYTSQDSGREFETLPHLKYIKQILYRQIQKNKRILGSIENAHLHNWPRDETKSGHKKALSATQSLEQDFQHLLDYAQALQTRTTEAISVLMSSISILEAQTARSQAQRIGKLTFLAFIFVPLGFTTSFFGMNVRQIEGGNLGIHWWVVFSVAVTAGAVAMFYLDLLWPFKWLWKMCKKGQDNEGSEFEALKI